MRLLLVKTRHPRRMFEEDCGNKKPIVNRPRCDGPLDDVDRNITSILENVGSSIYRPFKVIGGGRITRELLEKGGVCLLEIWRTDRASGDVMLAFKCLRQSITL
ncbi:hypothetical protein BYT27DRAFT_7188373, partial [Phlegmacium glaucopus]